MVETIQVQTDIAGHLVFIAKDQDGTENKYSFLLTNDLASALVHVLIAQHKLEVLTLEKRVEKVQGIISSTLEREVSVDEILRLLLPVRFVTIKERI